jgi:type I restriction enzyme S subunit
MSEWTEKTIGDLCSKVIDYRGKTPPKVSNGIKLITSRVIKNGRITIDADHEFIPSELYDSVMRRGIPELGDVLITTEAPLGEIAMIISTERIAIAQRVILLRANKEIVLPKFLYLSLKAPIGQGRIHAKATGTTVLGIKNPELKNVALPIPPLPIQQKIATILSAYDDLIENNLKQIKLLEEMAQITYEEWFVRFKFPNYENTPVDEVTGLPFGWERKTCFDVMNVLSGGTPKTDEESYWNGKIPFFTPKDASSFSYTLETEKHMTDKGLKQCNSKLYPKNTVFITARGTVGKLNLARHPMAMNQSCYALVAKDGLTQYFLFLSLNSTIGNFKSVASGGVFDTIVVDTFRYMPFVLPPKSLIDKFEEKISPLYSQVVNSIEQNQLLKEARDILLPRLMTGKIAV